ncbi:MAG: hypothetical protein WCT85_04160 [Parachlamydiales bacterium]|jgi:hypothetical protein
MDIKKQDKKIDTKDKKSMPQAQKEEKQTRSSCCCCCGSKPKTKEVKKSK